MSNRWPEPILVSEHVGLPEVKQLLNNEADSAGVFRSRLADVSQQIWLLEAELEQSFEIEVDLRQQIATTLSPLRTEKQKLEEQLQFFDAGYDAWMTFEPLSWRNEKTGLPVFALFTLDSPDAYFELSWCFDIRVSGIARYSRPHYLIKGPLRLESQVEERYQDVIDRLESSDLKPQTLPLDEKVTVRLGD